MKGSSEFTYLGGHMSRTTRRTKFNSKKRFFKHYWEVYSEQEVKQAKYLKEWQYHSDNYYTKSCKNSKQFLKKMRYHQARQEFKQKLHSIKTFSYQEENFEIVLESHKYYNIKWDLH